VESGAVESGPWSPGPWSPGPRSPGRGVRAAEPGPSRSGGRRVHERGEAARDTALYRTGGYLVGQVDAVALVAVVALARQPVVTRLDILHQVRRRLPPTTRRTHTVLIIIIIIIIITDIIKVA